MQYKEGNKSEVARIRHQIEMESQAMVHAQMFAVTASHQIINHKYEALSTLTDQLSDYMPREQAMTTMLQTHNAAIEQAHHDIDDQKQVL